MNEINAAMELMNGTGRQGGQLRRGKLFNSATPAIHSTKGMDELRIAGLVASSFNKLSRQWKNWIGGLWLPPSTAHHSISAICELLSFQLLAHSIVFNKEKTSGGISLIWLKLGEMRVGWLSWLGSKPITVYSVIWRVKLFNEGGNQQFINNSISLNQQK